MEVLVHIICVNVLNFEFESEMQLVYVTGGNFLCLNYLTQVLLKSKSLAASNLYQIDIPVHCPRELKHLDVYI